MNFVRAYYSESRSHKARGHFRKNGNMNAIGLVLLLAHFDPSAATAEAVVRRAIEARSSLKTMHTKFRYERYATIEGTLKPEQMEEVECWFDETHYRMDRIREGKVTIGTDIGRRLVVCKNCERHEHTIFYTEGVTGVELLSPSDKLSKGYMSLCYNPLRIGYSLWYMSASTYSSDTDPLGADISSKSFTPPTLSNATYRDEPAILLRSNYVRSGATHTVTILPNKGYNVAKIESSLNEGTDRYTSTQTTDLQFDAAAKVWFPKKAIFEQATNGKVTYREVVAVRECEINRPISDRVFSLAGISIHPSTTVFTPEAKNSTDYEWSGTALVRRKDDPYSVESTSQLDVPMSEPVDADAVRGNRIWYYVAAAGLFLVAAGLLFWWAMRKRTKA